MWARGRLGRSSASGVCRATACALVLVPFCVPSSQEIEEGERWDGAAEVVSARFL